MPWKHHVDFHSLKPPPESADAYLPQPLRHFAPLYPVIYIGAQTKQNKKQNKKTCLDCARSERCNGHENKCFSLSAELEAREGRPPAEPTCPSKAGAAASSRWVNGSPSHLLHALKGRLWVAAGL